MSSITHSGMANSKDSREAGVKSALEQKFERLQNNLEPQVEDLQKRLGQLQHDFNILKWWLHWLSILLPIIIAVMAAVVLAVYSLHCGSNQPMDSRGQDRRCFVVSNYSKIAVSGEVTTAHLLVNKSCHKMPEDSELQCELAFGKAFSDTRNISCSLKKEEAGRYKISYHLSLTPGKYQLRINKINGELVQGNATNATVHKEFSSTPNNTLTGLKAPQGIAFNDRGDMIVAEYREHKVSIFNPWRKKLNSFGTMGSEPGQFNHPTDVAVDDDGNILVVDQKNHRIQKFKPDPKNGTLNFITEVGRNATLPLDFDFPVGIAIHPHTKMIYITENKKTNCIQILYPNLTLFGNLLGEFNQAKDIAFDGDGNIYVADNENHRIQVFTQTGDLVRQFGIYGEGRGELKYPSGVSIGSDGLLYVAELYNYRVSVFTQDGTYLTSFANGTKGSEPGQLNNPRGVTVDKNGIIYVSDHGNDRILIFKR